MTLRLIICKLTAHGGHKHRQPGANCGSGSKGWSPERTQTAAGSHQNRADQSTVRNGTADHRGHQLRERQMGASDGRQCGGAERHPQGGRNQLSGAYAHEIWQPIDLGSLSAVIC